MGLRACEARGRHRTARRGPTGPLAQCRLARGRNSTRTSIVMARMWCCMQVCISCLAHQPQARLMRIAIPRHGSRVVGEFALTIELGGGAPKLKLGRGVTHGFVVEVGGSAVCMGAAGASRGAWPFGQELSFAGEWWGRRRSWAVCAAGLGPCRNSGIGQVGVVPISGLFTRSRAGHKVVGIGLVGEGWVGVGA